MRTFQIGDVENFGSEIKHREWRRQMPMQDLDGNAYPYFPLHAGHQGADPSFPDSADHVATVIAHAGFAGRGIRMIREGQRRESRQHPRFLLRG